MKIYLSPSTQEHNVGTGAYGTEEKQMNLIATIVEMQLKNYGHVVYRNTPAMSLAQIVTDSNEKMPDIHISIHSNAGNKLARGAEIFCHKFGSDGERLAICIYKYLEPITPSRDRGIKEGVNRFGLNKPLYETAYTDAPSVIIEVAFHDNKDDALWIAQNTPAIADAIVKGINDYSGTLKLTPPPTSNWKKEDLKKMVDYGLIKDYNYWENKLDENIPVWAVISMLKNMLTITDINKVE